MFKYLSILFCLLTQIIFAQDKKATVLISGRITNFITNSNIANVKIEVYKNGTLIETKATSSNGKYKLAPLEIDDIYKVIISSPGLVTRFFELDLKSIPDDEKYGGGWEIPTDIPLVERISDVDFSSIEPKRTSIIKFKKAENKLDWDYNEITSYRNELKKLLEKAEHKKENSTNPVPPVITENPKLIEEADNALALNDFENAIKLYNQAIASNPSKKSEIANKIEETKKVQKKLLLEEQLLREYNQFVVKGNEELNLKQYDKAIEYYRQALLRKPNDKIANDKIEEANKLKNEIIKTLPDNATNINVSKNNSTTSEQKKNETINANNSNSSTINEHKPVCAKKDTSIINSQKTNITKKNVTNNTSNNSNTKNVKTNVNNNSSTVNTNANKGIVNTNTQSANTNNNIEYKKAIENGNTELSAGNFEKSIAFFNKALTLKENDSYAKKQRMRAQNLWDEDIASKQKMYLQIIDKADEYFNAKNYTEAKDLYERASGFNKKDIYPKNKIAECDKLLKPIEPVVKVEEIKTKTPQDPNYAETEAKELMQLTKQRLEVNQNNFMINEKAEIASFYNNKATEDINRSYVDQELLNYNLYNRTKLYKSKDVYRIARVNETQSFIDELRDKYRKKNREYAIASYNNQQNINMNRFELNTIITGKDLYRKKSINRLATFVDNELLFLSNRKDLNREITKSNTLCFNKQIEDGSAFSRNASSNYMSNANYYKDFNDKISSNSEIYKTEGKEQINSNKDVFKNKSAPVIKSYTTEELQKLARDFGDGVHQWTEKKTNPEMVVYETKIRRIVVKNGEANDYTMIQNRWGSVFTKNGKSIVEHTWQIETAGKIKEYNPE